MAISVVQSNIAINSSVSFGSNTTAGNTLVVIIGSYLTTVAPSVTAVKIGGSADNFGSAVSHQTTGISGFEDVGLFIWYDYNCAGGQTAIAVTGSNLSFSSGGGTAIYEVSGLLATSGSLDQTNSAGASTTGTSTSGSITPSISNEIVFGGSVESSAASPSGFTNQSVTSFVAGYQIISSTSALSYGSGTVSWYANAIASFEAAGSGGPMLAFPF